MRHDGKKPRVRFYDDRDYGARPVCRELTRVELDRGGVCRRIEHCELILSIAREPMRPATSA